MLCRGDDSAGRPLRSAPARRPLRGDLQMSLVRATTILFSEEKKKKETKQSTNEGVNECHQSKNTLAFSFVCLSRFVFGNVLFFFFKLFFFVSHSACSVKLKTASGSCVNGGSWSVGSRLRWRSLRTTSSQSRHALRFPRERIARGIRR